jgi:hypothetical protein
VVEEPRVPTQNDIERAPPKCELRDLPLNSIYAYVFQAFCTNNITVTICVILREHASENRLLQFYFSDTRRKELRQDCNAQNSSNAYHFPDH